MAITPKNNDPKDLDQKLIVPNDYQQFWVYFEWFLSLFQISDVK